MNPGTRLPEPPRELWRSVLWAGVTLLAVGVIGLWLLFSLILWGFRCDENCGVGDAESWRWTGQFVLAALGGSLGIAGLASGFTSRWRMSLLLLGLSAVCALYWITWVLGSGTF
jgi:hypothetical protein